MYLDISKSKKELIEEFILKILETKEYKDIEYLVSNIRNRYLQLVIRLKNTNFQIPEYIKPLTKVIMNEFNDSGISKNDMCNYICNDGSNDFSYIYEVFLDNDNEQYNLDNLFWLSISGYIIDKFRDTTLDIQNIINKEKFKYKTNQYGLTLVDKVEFHNDYFIYDNKAYLYSLLTNISLVDSNDTMPAFAKIIKTDIKSGDLLLRLDERLALPENQAIHYSTTNSMKYYGPQFHFNNNNLPIAKEITVHINEKTQNKLIFIVKPDFDKTKKEKFFHIEIETLPFKNMGKNKHCITTFIHGMYYPSYNQFTHIDYTKNQYNIDKYYKKYFEKGNTRADLYTEKDLHYKIWCVENGKYSIETWYKLVIASLDKEYKKLLNEILIGDNYEF